MLSVKLNFESVVQKNAYIHFYISHGANFALDALQSSVNSVILPLAMKVRHI